MAEFLIKATSANWMDDTSKWAVKGVTQEMYDKRSLKGDIFIVRDNKHPWGKCECPPQYVVVKIPDLDWVKAKQILENCLMEDTGTLNGQGQPILIMRKKRIYKVPTVVVDNILANGGVLTVTKAQAINYIRKRRLNASKTIEEDTITAQEFV